MAAQIENMNLKDLDKSAWKTYRFEQIAKSISERVDPNNTDLKIYVGLEHLDAEYIHIKRYGTPDDVDGQKLRCYPGDVIFGKRRAYQRKAAVVDFDGFCSAHAMVLRANPDVMDPRLFPFFLHSDTFMHRAIDISVGSLSPTINWGTLKTQEFLLPPKDQQAKLAELLWAMDAVVEKEVQLMDNIKVLLDSIVSYDCFNPSIDKAYVKTRLRSVVKSLEAGTSVNCESRDFMQTDIGVLKKSAITGHEFYPSESKAVILSELSRLKIKVSKHSILMNRKNTKQLVGASKFIEDSHDNLFLPDLIWNITIDSRLASPKFMWYYLSSPKMRSKISSLSSGTSFSMVNISQKRLLDLEIGIPSLEVQKTFLYKYEKIEVSLKKIKENIQTSKSLQKSLINQIF